jgi:hypothetical protein
MRDFFILGPVRLFNLPFHRTIDEYIVEQDMLRYLTRRPAIERGFLIELFGRKTTQYLPQLKGGLFNIVNNGLGWDHGGKIRKD